MDVEQFWTLIDTIDRSRMSSDSDSAVAILISSLAQLPKSEIEMFQELLAEQLYALDGRAYAESAGRTSRMGDDGFLYARCFVVAQGRGRFEATLDDPLKMPTALDDWFEALLYAAPKAYKRVTGEKWNHSTSVSYETGSNRAKW